MRKEQRQGIKQWPRDFEEKDVQVMYGSMVGGMFVGLKHLPTGVTVQDGSMKGRQTHVVLGELQTKLIKKVREHRQKQPPSRKMKK